MNNVDDVKRIYSISGVLGTGKKLIVCPLPEHMHSNHTPSFSIFHDREGFERFKCHGNCGKEGDVIDLVGYLEIPGYDPGNDNDFMQAMARVQNKEMEVVIPNKPRSIETTSVAPNAWREYYPPQEQGMKYLINKRGLTSETIHKYKLGQKERNYVTFPAFENGTLTNVKFRRIGKGSPRYFELTGSRKSLYNYDGVAYTNDPIVVTKGHIPTLLLLQNNILACNITAGENGHIKEWFPQLSLARKRIYVGDNDLDRDIRKKMQAFAHERAEEIKADVKFPPERHKDLDDWILAEPQQALSEIRSWINS